MRLDDIRSPGYVPNAHALRKEVVRAISFCQVQGEESRAEKLMELMAFFREALTICDDELPKTEPELDLTRSGPIPSHTVAVPSRVEPVNEVKKGAGKGKATR